MMKVSIRDATKDDVTSIQAIYSHYVANTTASFEETPPPFNVMDQRRKDIQALGLPFYIAEIDNEIVGYAYAGLYRPRSAYRFTVEDSIYIGPDFVGQGVGKHLLTALIERCTELEYKQMIAVIGGNSNAHSIRLHERMGFKLCGVLENVGFKFNQWVNSTLMQRPL